MNLRTVAILRGHDPRKAAEIAQRVWEIGMDLVEVPAQGDGGWASLEAVADVSAGRPFGAGTVLTPEAAHRAAGVGASVIISPSVHPDVLEAAASVGALALPGVMTATDVAVAARHELSLCKLFPANIAGMAWLDAMRGPFPAMGFVAVGGVDADNAGDFLRAGAAGVGFGGSIEALLERDDAAAIVAELHAIADRHGAPGVGVAT